MKQSTQLILVSPHMKRQIKAAVETFIPMESLQTFDYHPIEIFTNVLQKFTNVRQSRKLEELLGAMRRLGNMDKRVVICSYSTRMCTEISMLLKDNGFGCVALPRLAKDDGFFAQKLNQFIDGSVKIVSVEYDVLREIPMDGVIFNRSTNPINNRSNNTDFNFPPFLIAG